MLDLIKWIERVNKIISDLFSDTYSADGLFCQLVDSAAGYSAKKVAFKLGCLVIWLFWQ